MKLIIERYKGDRKLIPMLAWLNEGLHTPIATRTFFNWLSGETKPNRRILRDILAAYPDEDPRHRLASDLIEEIDSPAVTQGA